MELGEYLQGQSGRHWRAGIHDCCTHAADWVCTWGLGDPMAEWRGLYRTDEEARCLINRAGGLLALWQRGLSAIGIDGVNEPQPGDVGVVMGLGEAGQPEPVGAIYTGRRWSFRAPSGLFFASADVLRAWGHRG